jgi:hypothetical protein
MLVTVVVVVVVVVVVDDDDDGDDDNGVGRVVFGLVICRSLVLLVVVEVVVDFFVCLREIRSPFGFV